MQQLSEIRSDIRQRRLLSEQQIVDELLSAVQLNEQQRENIAQCAYQLIETLRQQKSPGLMESFLAEYGLSTDEGVALMCLAEAYLRTPDDLTLDALIRDKIGESTWSRHKGGADSPFVNVTTWALMLTGKVFRHKKHSHHDITDTMLNVVQRMGEPIARVAVGEAMKLMGHQFVLGRDINEAIANGRKLREKGYRYSYDMLGEAARTDADAQRYFLSYSHAISNIAQQANSAYVHDNPGISVKLSALHPRYEYVQKQVVMKELVPRLAALTQQACAANIGLNIDAEEMDRLDLSLDVIETVISSPSLAEWEGFGIVVQAYSKQALCVLDWINAMAIKLDRKFSVRLVKGAYWDTEIKNAQILGLRRYPVFTQKPSTDLSYIACSMRLLAYSERIYPQFATHNANTICTINEIANENQHFEFQRLHGMGEALHALVKNQSNRGCRIYAPVGIHKDLLAYLVRRLLENGANSSFVNQVLNSDIPIEHVVADPYAIVKEYQSVRHPNIPLPKDIYKGDRQNSIGWNLNEQIDAEKLESGIDKFKQTYFNAHPLIAEHTSQGETLAILNPNNRSEQVGEVIQADANDVDVAISVAEKAWASWHATPVLERAECLKKAADLLEENTPELIAITSREAGKTRLDGILEVREAVDFLRYYATQAIKLFSSGDNHSLGPVVCISPWNFPLAIFTGQISAALAAGNTVIAKPAEQTPLIAYRTVELFYQAGIPRDVLCLLPGDGASVGAKLTSDPRIKGICFTGSTQTAQLIDLAMATKGDPSAPLIAETGGINAMIVDSTALPEQAVRDIVLSAFQSAGQRCSALRLLLVQEEIAKPIIAMLKGAAKELVIGDSYLTPTDVGPVIDNQARETILNHMENLDQQDRCLFKISVPKDCDNGSYVPLAAYQLESINELKQEIFGPVLHVVSYQASQLEKIVEQINANGYGLTLGVHSRVDERMDRICELANVGNIYLNRNQIGAVVGVQPFGGEGLSGTGPKAGGPHYLYRFLAKYDHEADIINAENQHIVSMFNVLHSLRDDLQSSALAALKRASSVNIKPQQLVGPTGERNTYMLKSRGTVVCAGADTGGDIKALLTQCILSLACGNRTLIASEMGKEELKPLLDYFSKARMVKPLIKTSDDELSNICADKEFDVLAIDKTDLREIRTSLAKRQGPRIVVLNSNDAANLYYLEQVVSEDTTASGGNAKLLSGL